MRFYLSYDTKSSLILRFWHAWIQRGDRGSVPHPLKNHKNIGFLSNTCPDCLKITKLPSQHSMFGHHWHASETPFKWRFAGGLMMASLKWYLVPPLIN